MTARRRLALTLCAASLAVATPARAGIVYDEALSGDLSGNGLGPTSISVGVGSNEIYGSTGSDLSGTDRDYFVISVPTGHEIVALVEKQGTTTAGGFSFLAVQAGPQVTVPVEPADATGLLGWVHFFTAIGDADILPDLGLGGFGATNFVPPLPAGMYAFWIQDVNFGSTSYRFDFVIAVPEPGVAAAAAAGLLRACGFAHAVPALLESATAARRLAPIRGAWRRRSSQRAEGARSSRDAFWCWRARSRSASRSSTCCACGSTASPRSRSATCSLRARRWRSCCASSRRSSSA